jgi:hypothetical protein
VLIAAIDTHVKMADRIFVKGLNADNKQIGTYNSTKELYVNPKKAPKSFTTKGKSGKTKFENGKNRQTGYFESYAEYRSKVGRLTDKVNLVLFGNLQSDFLRVPIKTGKNKFSSTVTRNNSGKVDGAQDKYGNVFSLTKQERNNCVEVLKFESIARLNGK